MTLFHLIGLLLLITFIGTGAKIGYNFYGFIGSIIGAVTGCGSLYLIFKVLTWDADLWPICRCGNSSQENFDEWVEDKTFGFVMKCNLCGKQYVMQSGNKWYEITNNKTKKLYMKKKFLGKWKFE